MTALTLILTLTLPLTLTLAPTMTASDCTAHVLCLLGSLGATRRAMHLRYDVLIGKAPPGGVVREGNPAGKGGHPPQHKLRNGDVAGDMHVRPL